MRSYPAIAGMSYGSLFDATQTMALPTEDEQKFRLFHGMTTRTLTQADGRTIKYRKLLRGLTV